LAQWEAYFALEPFGEEQAWLRTGILTSVLANIYRDTSKRGAPFTPSDFVPHWDKDEELDMPKWRVIQESAKMWAAATGTELVRL